MIVSFSVSKCIVVSTKERVSNVQTKYPVIDIRLIKLSSWQEVKNLQIRKKYLLSNNGKKVKVTGKFQTTKIFHFLPLVHSLQVIKYSNPFETIHEEVLHGRFLLDLRGN